MQRIVFADLVIATEPVNQMEERKKTNKPLIDETKHRKDRNAHDSVNQVNDRQK